MLARGVRVAVAVLMAATVTTMTSGTAGGQAAPANPAAGPPYDFTTEIMHGGVVPLKNAAMLTRTKHGYRYRAGQQDGHLVVTRVKRGLRFVDSGTKELRKLARACRRQKVKVGIAAVCPVPRGTSTRRPLLVEVWPRLGDDLTDGSELPATIALSVLGDEGHDVARLGAGPDFFNGHSGRDRVSGGAGNDWIRAGLGNDRFSGGPGDDRLVGMEGRDAVFGGKGHDRVGGGEGNDRLYAGTGEDFVLCGTGADRARVDDGDFVLKDCETVRR